MCLLLFSDLRVSMCVGKVEKSEGNKRNSGISANVFNSSANEKLILNFISSSLLIFCRLFALSALPDEKLFKTWIYLCLSPSSARSFRLVLFGLKDITYACTLNATNNKKQTLIETWHKHSQTKSNDTNQQQNCAFSFAQLWMMAVSRFDFVVTKKI